MGNLAELGRELFYGIRRRRNYHKAFPLILQAARSGWVHWQYLAGYSLAHGLGVERNLRAARRWYAKAGSKRHPGALFNLALMYDQGRGVRHDYRRAFRLYEKGAKLGDPAAQCNLALAYLDGRGTARSLRDAIRWFRMAAAKGDPKAQYNLGLAYLEGEGVRKSK